MRPLLQRRDDALMRAFDATTLAAAGHAGARKKQGSSHPAVFPRHNHQKRAEAQVLQSNTAERASLHVGFEDVT